MLCSSVALSRFDGVKVFACILVTCCDFALFIGGRKRWWDGTGGGLMVEEELQSDVGNRLKVIFVLAKCIGIIIRGWKVKIFSKLCAVWPLIVVQLRNWIIYKLN